MSNSIKDHPLMLPFRAAISQAMYGKGKRHGGAARPFTEQPMFQIAEDCGIGFLAGQADKKLREAMRSIKSLNPHEMNEQQREAFIRETLGALVYLGGAVIQFCKESGHEMPGEPLIDSDLLPPEIKQAFLKTN